MKKSIVSGMTVTLLLISMLTSNAQALKSEHTQEYSKPLTADIIHPVPGQFANYYMRFYYPSSDFGWWNMSYTEYVEPHVINTTIIVELPGASDIYWCTVDTTSRLVTDAHPDLLYWNQSWYFAWIETGVTYGSTIDWFDTTATIVGSRILYVVERYIDCWVANTSAYEYDYVLSYYDKITGLMVAYQHFHYDELYLELGLKATDIPIGEKLSTAVYFDLNPNPAGVGEAVTLKGILIDEFSQPLAGETVKLYARPLAGSWRYITSLTSDGYGIFTWQAKIPIEGTFIFVAYYPGSETYERSYNFAILIVVRTEEYEDFTTYTEVDPNDHIEKTAEHIDHDAYHNEDAYVYKDKGIGHFGDFQHKVDVYWDYVSVSVFATGIVWMLSNNVDDARAHYDNSWNHVIVRFQNTAANEKRIALIAMEGGSWHSDCYDCSLDTWYYLTIKRQGSTLTCRIYSDSARTNLLDTLSITCPTTKFRYVYACNSQNDGRNRYVTTDIENLALQEGTIVQ